MRATVPAARILLAVVAGAVGLRVAGLAAIPGWQWLTKLGRMRTLGASPQAPVLMDRATAARLGISRIRHWFADVDRDWDEKSTRAALKYNPDFRDAKNLLGQVLINVNITDITDESGANENFAQVMLQYNLSLGAHGAHSF